MRDDDDLVAAAKRGDAAAWRELYQLHAGRLILWLEARSGSGTETPEDLAAAAWLVAAEKVADFTGSTSDFGGWLFGIARNHGANAARRGVTRARGNEALRNGHHPTDPGPEVRLIADEWLRQALASLPPRERDVIACLEVLDLDVSQTAATLDMSAVAVRVARHRGLKRLRSSMAAPDGSHD